MHLNDLSGAVSQLKMLVARYLKASVDLPLHPLLPVVLNGDCPPEVAVPWQKGGRCVLLIHP